MKSSEIRKNMKKNQWKEVGLKTGLGYDKVRSLYLGNVANPKYTDIEKLKDYFFSMKTEKEKMLTLRRNTVEMISEFGRGRVFASLEDLFFGLRDV